MNITEYYRNKYKKQIDASKLVSYTKKNYNNASVYYEKRKNMFLNQLTPKIKNEILNLNDNEAFRLFMDKWEKFQKRVLEEVNKSDINLETAGKRYFQIKGKKIETELDLKDFIGKKDSGSQKRVFATPFEKALTSFFNENILAIENSANNFIAQHTAQITQKGLTFKGARQIRSDIAIKQTNQSIPNNMELNLQMDNIEPRMVSKKQWENILGEYLQQGKIIGGISVKNYTEGMTYTSSLELMEKLNEEFYDYNIRDAKYADVYMRYFLSKYVIAITSPSIIGLLTNKGFTWMDDLLRRSRYYFHLRQDVNKESIFHVANSSIYLAQKDSARKYSSISYEGQTRLVHTIQGAIKEV